LKAVFFVLSQFAGNPVYANFVPVPENFTWDAEQSQILYLPKYVAEFHGFPNCFSGKIPVK
jgi:hypothetical protein